MGTCRKKCCDRKQNESRCVPEFSYWAKNLGNKWIPLKTIKWTGTLKESSVNADSYYCDNGKAENCKNVNIGGEDVILVKRSGWKY